MVFKLGDTTDGILGTSTLGPKFIFVEGGGARSIPHDFKNYPELTNTQIQESVVSPHKQITEDFRALVVKVHDGDTITLRWEQRDFDFTLRFLGIDAPEMNEGGEEARDWLRGQIEGEKVDILIDKRNRVGKYGRLLGKVIYNGIDIGKQMIRENRVTTFDARNEGKFPDINKEFNIKQWF